MAININKVIMGQFKDYVFIIIGLTLYAFGFTAFILPQKLVMGGVTGVASLLYYKFGLNVALMGFLLNATLLLMAYKIVGKQFVLRTLFGITALNVIIGIMQPFFPEAIFAPDSVPMNLMIGGILCGSGVGICFVHNGSTGGTDIAAAMLNKLTNVSIGRLMIYVDWCVISSSYLIFQSVDKIVYGYMLVTLASYIADQMINTNRQATQFTVISPHWQEISAAVIQIAHRGCTMVNGMGAFSGNEVKMLFIMCRKIESVTIFRIVKAIDPNAFITQTKVNGVYGYGFDEMKVKTHNKEGEAARAIAAEHVELAASEKNSEQ